MHGLAGLGSDRLARHGAARHGVERRGVDWIGWHELRLNKTLFKDGDNGQAKTRCGRGKA